MGRWPVVQKQKEQNAKERGKVFAIHAKLIALAAQKGADPSENSALAEAISVAKKANVPNDNIDRAIRNGSGQEKGAAAIEEVTYEGYGVGGVAIVIKALTDNRNRTAPSMRHAFSKCGGSLGETGSVSNFAFKYRGIIELPLTEITPELEEIIIESGAEDYRLENGEVVIETVWSDLMKVAKFLAAKNITYKSANFEYLPSVTVTLEEFDKALKVHTLIETLEEDEDVAAVWHNAIIPDDIAAQIITHVEKARFRT